MAISKSCDPSKDLTIFTVEGEITFQEHKTVLEDFYKEKPTANVIWDFRLIRGKRISRDEIKVLINFIKNHGGKRVRGKSAVVTQTDLDFGLSRMSHAYIDMERIPLEIEIFRNMEEALEWMFGQPRIF